MTEGPAPADGFAEELLGHADVLFRFAMARVRHRATAEDLVQETFVAAVLQRGTFRADASLRTWLIGILRHKAIDHLRREARRPVSLGDATPTDGMEPWFNGDGSWTSDPNRGLEALDGTPGDGIERAELRAALAKCIRLLPSALHRVFVLRELDELEPESVCEVAGISRESLAVFLYRARQSLRTCLQRRWVDS